MLAFAMCMSVCGAVIVMSCCDSYVVRVCGQLY